MPCYAPLQAFYGASKGPSGKRPIVFNRGASHSGAPLRLPCGQCVGCRLDRSRQWAMRCVHESKAHRYNRFVTLTYADEYLPVGGTLVKRDFQLFMKRLRKRLDGGVRFYACGEYGDMNMRPHYHALLFGCEFPDEVYHSSNSRGEKYYTSGVLRELWPQGHHVIGDVTFDSAAYVARYVVKKITGPGAEAHYAVVDGDGVVHDRIPEFTLMSRRPGIGTAYWDEFGHEIVHHGNVIINGVEVRPPRFYEEKMSLWAPFMAELHRRERKRIMHSRWSDNLVDRRRVKEVLAIKRLQLKRREV